MGLCAVQAAWGAVRGSLLNKLVTTTRAKLMHINETQMKEKPLCLPFTVLKYHCNRVKWKHRGDFKWQAEILPDLPRRSPAKNDKAKDDRQPDLPPLSSQ